jgi:hypothetical protein
MNPHSIGVRIGVRPEWPLGQFQSVGLRNDRDVQFGHSLCLREKQNSIADFEKGSLAPFRRCRQREQIFMGRGARMDLFREKDDWTVSRRGFIAGGLMSLVAAATHADALGIDDNGPTTLSTMLDVDLRRLVSRGDLDWDEPASRSEEGMPLGNGVMGSLVWTTSEAIHFQINRADVYAMNRESDSFPRRSTDYCNGCGFVDLNFVDFGDDVFAGSAFHQHLNLYDALMTLRGAGISARVLAWANNDVFAIEIDDQRPAPAPINIDLRMLRYHMDADYDNLKSINGKLVAQRDYDKLLADHTAIMRTAAHTATSRLNIDGERIILTQAFEEDKYYDGSAVVIAGNGRPVKAKYLNETTVRLSAAPGQGKFTVYIASAASFNRTEDVVAQAGSKVDAAAAKGFSGLLADNQAWWHDYWGKGFVHLHSTDGQADFVEANYSYFLYVMAATSRGPYPPRFGGLIFYTTGDMHKWGSQHWWNNDGLYYEGFMPSNRLELFDPVFKMYSGNYDSYAQAAQKQWGSQGIWIPETTWFDGIESLPDDVFAEMQDLFLVRKPWEQRSETFQRVASVKQSASSRWNFINQEGSWDHGVWIIGDKGRGCFGHTTHIFSSTAKIAYVYWLRYDSTRDVEFLRKSAYPMLKGTAEFYRNFPNLKKDADGKYHIYHVNNHEGIWDAQDTQEEISAIQGIAPLAILASQILGVDEDLRPKWQELLENLTPLPTNETVHTRKPGDPEIWVATASSVPYRGLADLPLAYYDLCTIATEDPETLAIGKATYAAAPTSNIAGLSRKIVTAAKMGEREDFKRMITNQLAYPHAEPPAVASARPHRNSVMRNRLSTSEGPGCTNLEYGGTAAAALHAALLLDSPPAPGKPSILQVFAACPQDWDTEFTLLARGAFLVTSSQRNGVVEFVELKSQTGGDCRLRNPWGDAEAMLYRNGKQDKTLRGGLLHFDTAKDELVLVLKKGTVPAQFKRGVARDA